MEKEYFVKCTWGQSQPLRREHVNGKVYLDLTEDCYEINQSAKDQMFNRWVDVHDFNIDFMIEVPKEVEVE